jgi:hypothetical protein
MPWKSTAYCDTIQAPETGDCRLNLPREFADFRLAILIQNVGKKSAARFLSLSVSHFKTAKNDGGSFFGYPAVHQLGHALLSWKRDGLKYCFK